MNIDTTKVYKHIQKAFNGGFRVVSEQGSARSSKTYNTVIWLVVHCLQNADTSVSIVRKTLPAIKSSVFRDFIEILTNIGVYNRANLNKSDFIYTFENGSFIEFFSADNEQKLRGRKRNILYVNEANEISFLEWQQLKMRTTKFCIIDYNPSFDDDHWISVVNKEENTYHFITTYKDNPFLEREVVQEIESLKGRNESLWNVYGLGIQAVIEGRIFNHYEIIESIPNNIKHRWIGMDFGYENDPTAIVLVGILGEKCYIQEIEYSTKMLLNDIISTLKTAYNVQGERLKIIADSSDPREIAEIRRAGLNIHAVRKYSGSIIAGINKMKQYQLFLVRGSSNIEKEVKSYTYQQDKSGKWMNDPIDRNNHAMDAIRYVFMSEIMGGERKPLDKDRLSKIIY